MRAALTDSGAGPHSCRDSKGGVLVRLARVQAGRGMPALALLTGDDAVLLAGAGSGGGTDPLLDALRAGPLSGLDRTGERVPRSEVRVLAPLRRPGKIVAVGLNYADHTAETGLDAPAEPLTFAKYPTSVVGPGDAVTVPASLTRQVDWEGELAAVIGTECGPRRRGTTADVAGYTIANDISARDLQFGDGQWTRGKSLDTFCPLGPELVTPDELGDVQDLAIRTVVNGVTMQDASTADMIFDVAALLHHLTAAVTLEPGDVVLTGTPPGVGAFRTPPVFLQDGDTVTVQIAGLGELTNPVRHTLDGGVRP